MAALTLSDRLAGLSARERKFLFVGAIALLLFLLYLMIPSGGGEESGVELADVPPAPAAVQLPPPPPPMPVVSAPPPSAAPAPAGTAGMILQGVSGGGPGGGAALFQFPTGGQRLVRIGREIVPGMVLRSVGPTFAVVSSGGGDLRLDLGKAGAVQVAAAPAPAVTAPPPAVASADQVATRVETTEFRMGMQPIRTDGQIRAHQIKEGASLPRLQQAGLRPGDIITRVNGSMLNEEQLMELSWTMTNSERTEFEVIRGGKPVKLVYQPNAIRQ